MIKYRKGVPGGSVVGISGIANSLVYSNSRFILLIVKLFRIPQSETLIYVVSFITFWLIFFEVYLFSSVVKNYYVLHLHRFKLLFIFSLIIVFFGRLSFPYWSESDEEEDED